MLDPGYNDYEHPGSNMKNDSLAKYYGMITQEDPKINEKDPKNMNL